jgi:hypothetical protein
MKPRTLVEAASAAVKGAVSPQKKQYRIYFVGNSHLAAIKLGWDVAGAQYPSVQPVFYGASKRQMDSVTFEAGALVPTSEVVAEEIAKVSGGVTSVHLDDADLVCLVGLQFGFLNLLRLIHRFRTHSMVPLAKQSRLISRACLQQTYRERLEASIALKLARSIKSESAVPLLLVESPIPSTDLIQTDPWMNIPGEQAKSTIAEAFSIYRRIVSELGTSEGIRIVSQPPETIGRDGLSRVEFTRGSLRLESQERHSDGDFSHMNQDYGARILDEILKRVGVEKGIA